MIGNREVIDRQWEGKVRGWKGRETGRDEERREAGRDEEERGWKGREGTRLGKGKGIGRGRGWRREKSASERGRGIRHCQP